MAKNDLKDLFIALGADLSDEQFQLATLQGLISAEISMKRQELGLNQKQLAEKLGVSQTMVSRWEAGDCNFTLSSLVKISSVLDLPMQSPFVPRPPIQHVEHNGNVIHISAAPGWSGHAAATSYSDVYTIEQALELKEN